MFIDSTTKFCQDCKTEAANKPSTLSKAPDYVATGNGKMNPTERTKMKPYLAKAESWIKNILANFTGAKLLYYNSFFSKYLPDSITTEPMFVTAGIKGRYESKMMFFEYYCYDKKYPIQTEGESGFSVYVNFNNVFANGLTSDAGVYSVNGNKAFKIIKKKQSEGRIDFYEQRAQNNATAKMYTANDYIILRNSDEPVFIPITRKEYLQQMLKDAESFGSKDKKLMTDVYTQNVKQFEAEMKAYKLDKSYTPEKEAKRRKWFEEDQEKLKKVISKNSPESDAAKEVILQYLKKPQEWLNRGVKSFYSYSSYTAGDVTHFVESMDKFSLNGVGDKKDETLEEIVTINPACFNKTLSSDVPQVIMVHLRNGYYPHMEKVSALVKKPGALAPLEDLLNPNKFSTLIIAPTETPSTYTLNYLPKLKSLTPLIVPAGVKLSTIPVTPNYKNAQPAATLNFSLPPASAKLNQTPQLLTAENYSAYIQQLHSAISAAVKPNEKKKQMIM